MESPGNTIACQTFFTTEGAEISGSKRNRAARPTRLCGRLYGFFATRLHARSGDAHWRWRKRPKSAAPRFEECERKIGDRRRSQSQGRPERFRSHSFARSVADLGFAPNDNGRRLEVNEGRVGAKPYNRPRILCGAGADWLIPLLPFLSVVSVVKDTARDELSTKNYEEP